MVKTAIGLFKDSGTADKVVAHLLKSGFSRDEVRLVRRSDFDGTPGPETDILKIGCLPQEYAGPYWEAVRCGRVLVGQDGAIDVEEGTAKPVEIGVARVASSADPGLYPQRAAAQLFEVS